MKIGLTSDLHGNLPEVPSGLDLLIVAGDICPDKFKENRFVFPDPNGQAKWFAREFRKWWEGIECPVAATWGNHDWCGEQAIPGGGNLWVDELATCGGLLKIWLTPWSNPFGGWAFMKSPDKLAEIYAQIPYGIDILVSHQPPYGYGDTVDPRYIIGDADPHCGSKELLAAIDRVKPKMVVCGHIHGAFGSYRRGHYPSGTLGALGNEEPIAVTDIYNVSLVNEAYEPVNKIVVVEFEL